MRNQKDIRRTKLGLGLGLGLGIPIFAGFVAGVVYSIQTFSRNLIAEKGSQIFRDWWTGENGIGILDWTKEGHFPVNLPSTKVVDGGDVNDIKNFINDYLTPGILADGLMTFKTYDGLLTEETAKENKLIKAALKWDGTTDKTIVEFDLQMQPRDDEEAEILEDKATFTFQEKNGNKYGKITVNYESTISLIPETQFTCDSFDCMLNIDPSDTSLHTLGVNKKRGWEILYQPNENNQNVSIIVPYKDFGDNLDVIDGLAKDLTIDVDLPESLYVDQTGKYPIIAYFGGEEQEIDDCYIYLSQQGILKAFFENDKLVLMTFKPGKVDLIIKVISGKHFGTSYKSITIDSQE